MRRITEEMLISLEPPESGLEPCWPLDTRENELWEEYVRFARDLLLCDRPFATIFVNCFAQYERNPHDLEKLGILHDFADSLMIVLPEHLRAERRSNGNSFPHDDSTLQ